MTRQDFRFSEYFSADHQLKHLKKLGNVFLDLLVRNTSQGIEQSINMELL